MSIVAVAFLLTIPVPPAADDKPARKPVYTFLGTIKGEIDKVSDGGRKIEVKYKELVATTKTATNTLPRSSGGKMRLPPPKELVMKEKSQELELRVIDETVIRLIDGAGQSEQKSSPRKAGSAKNKKDAGKDEDTREEEKQDDPPAKKSPGKSTARKTEPQYPGKAGDVSSLMKGQIVVVNVYREDLPGYSRLVAHTIYILGEK